MVSTPTTRNRLELIGTGDKTNTWGSSLNSNVFTMVDEAMDGVALITVSGNVTLTSTNYTSDQARMRQLWLSGAGGFTVTIPGVEKWYLVRNACSAAVTFSAGGVTASVPASQSRMVFTNGTDVYVGDDGASLAYVDATFLKLTGGTMTGNITLVADGSNNLHPVTLQQLNAAVLAAAAGNLPALSGNALKFLRVNAGESSVEWAAVDLTGFQPIDADLTAIAALTSAANKVPYSTGAGTWAMADFSAAGRALVDDADNAAQRTTLGLGTISTQYANNVAITGGSVTGITDLAVADGGTGASDAAGARTNLGLGTMATQAASSVSISGGSITGITDIAVADGGTGASDAATARTNLGLAIGTNVQAYDPELAALASVTSAADALPYFTGSGTAGTTTLTSYARTLIDDADASTARTTLGLGTMATQAASSVSISGGSITGITDLAVADGGTGASTAAGAATNLGLGTGDSPQFTAVNVGHATDTTVTRVSAGRIAVEGSNVLMASDTGTSGTKIPYLDGANTFSAAQTINPSASGTRLQVGPGYNGGVAINAGESILDLAAWTGAPTYRLSRHNTNAWDIEIDSSGHLDFFDNGTASYSFLSSNVLQVNGNTVYTSANLPGTAITWTAAQTFNSASCIFNYQATYEGGRFALRTPASDTTINGNVRFDLFFNSLRIFEEGGSTRGVTLDFSSCGSQSSLYHSGNLPGTALSWTAQQTFNVPGSDLGHILITGSQNNLGLIIDNNQAGATDKWAIWSTATGSGFGAGLLVIGRYVSTPAVTINGSDVVAFSQTPTAGGNTVYHGGNLPGTAIVWTATQRFSSGEVRVSDNSAYYSWYNGANTVRSGYAQITSAGAGLLANEVTGGTWNITASSTVQINSNTAYHAGNLPGTAITWTAAQTFPNIVISSSAFPSIVLSNTGSSADARRWKSVVNGNVLSHVTENDAASVNETWMSITRSGTTVSTVSFPNGAVDIGGTLKARIAASTETTGTLTSASANKTIQLTGNITINNSVFAAGDVVVVYAGASSRTITAGTITTMRLDGTSTTGSRTVAAYGMASIFFVSATECVVSGGSVT